MHLPSGFQHRATSIGMYIGKLLAQQNIPDDVFIKALTIKQDRMPVNISDEEIAYTIVNKVVAKYRGRE